MNCVEVFGWFCLGSLGFGRVLREGSDPAKVGREGDNPDKGTTTTARDRDSNSNNNSNNNSQNKTNRQQNQKPKQQHKKNQINNPPQKKM